jgi:hypothetical protein
MKVPKNNPTPGEAPGRARERANMLAKHNHKLTPKKGGKPMRGSPSKPGC